MLLQDKSGIIFGVANKRSIAFGCARSASEQGARLILTYQNERLEAGTRQLADSLPNEAITMKCDVGSEASLDEAFAEIQEHMPVVDFGVHSIAYADRDELAGRYSKTSRDGWAKALEVSAFSFTAVAHRLEPLMTNGGSLVTMTYFGSEKVLPHYNVMGPAKAALECSVRYLAADLGPRGIRVNAVSAGAIRTLAASGVAGFSQFLDIAKEKAPLGRNTTPSEVGDATVFLISDLSRGVTGTTLWVDGGYHIMAL
jgi:enoyl-[acyl-carrier protein] reductase I